MGLVRTPASVSAASPLDKALEHRRWMLFVDGENLAARAAAVCAAESIKLPVGPYYEPGVFIWVPRVAPKVSFLDIKGGAPLHEHAHRAHYFTGVQGSDEVVRRIKQLARNCGFEPEVFPKTKGKHAKRVDVALASKMVGEAALNHYDTAVLIAGDEDFVPALQEVKRFGKAVYLAFFAHGEGGLSEELKLASDAFFDMTEGFCLQWIMADVDKKNDYFKLTT